MDLDHFKRLNDELASSIGFKMPPEFETAGLNLQVKGANFEIAEVHEKNLRLGIPPIPALMVIPGNIGYLIIILCNPNRKGTSRTQTS